MYKYKSSRPPLRFRLLCHLLRKEDHLALAGDFEEIYTDIVHQQGTFKASLWYWGQVFKSAPAFIKDSFFWSFLMFKNYVKVAFRNLKRQKGYSLINIAGLAIGMAVCILILFWVQDELSFDRFHKNAESVHRINILARGQVWPVVSIPLGPALKKDFPEIIESIRYSQESAIFARGDKKFEEFGAFADPSFLTTLNFPLKTGDPVSALSSPDSIIISEEFAQKFFEDENPMGQLIRMNNASDFRITGILKDRAANSHFEFDYLIPFEVLVQNDREPENFGRFQIFAYVQLQSNIPAQDVEAKIAGFMDRFEFYGNPQLRLQPLTSLHLHAMDGTGDIRYIYIFTIIAIFILVIACINFMNISTARSSTRAKEIGMRKVTGANRKDLIKQFMGESFLLSIIALVIAIVLVYLALPLFSNLAAKEMRFDLLGKGQILLGLLGVILFAGFFSGSYPALFLSAFKPANILRGALFRRGNRPGSLILRKALVIFQFTISISLIISTLVISRQLHYIRGVNIGLNREQVMYLPMRGNMSQQYQAIKDELLQNPQVQLVTAANQLPLNIGYTHTGFDWEGKNPEHDPSMRRIAVDFNFFETLGMEIVQGRGFSSEFTTDLTQAFILNESAIQTIEMESPIGKRFAAPSHDGLQEGQIIGVVKDFHFESLKEEIRPLVINLVPQNANYIFLKVNMEDTDISGLIGSLEKLWGKFAPEFPFTYRFLDEFFDRMYRAEQRTGDIFTYFTLLAVFVSCLGLFGLIAQMAELRTKEIGIRKVLGASVREITMLLSKEYLKWVVLANVAAWPLAFWAASQWLDNFALRTNIGIWIFVLAGFLALVIAFITVSFQSIRAALTNPADVLRYE